MAPKDGISVDIKGEAQIDYILGVAGPVIADRIMQQAIKDVATDIAKDAITMAPVQSGTLRRAIKAKSERAKPGLFVATVYITKGLQAKDDAWYWLFVEFGTVNQAPQPFVTPAYEIMKSDIERGQLMPRIGKRIIKQMASLRKKVS